jgi:GH18 family chitinase
MSTYRFDGVDIDWYVASSSLSSCESVDAEYPVKGSIQEQSDRSGSPADKANFPIFLRNMRTAFQAAGHSYGISITIPSSF